MNESVCVWFGPWKLPFLHEKYVKHGKFLILVCVKERQRLGTYIKNKKKLGFGFPFKDGEA